MPLSHQTIGWQPAMQSAARNAIKVHQIGTADGAKQFEVEACMRRRRRPPLAPDAKNALEVARRGVLQRIRRLRREVAEGCQEQADWLALHAELINALEQPDGNP